MNNCNFHSPLEVSNRAIVSWKMLTCVEHDDMLAVGRLAYHSVFDNLDFAFELKVIVAWRG